MGYIINNRNNIMSDKTRAEMTKEAMQTLIDTTNCMCSEREMVDGMLEALVGSHRTLQQSFFRIFVKMAEQYADANFDLRNEASVEFAKQIKEIDPHFPFV